MGYQILRKPTFMNRYKASYLELITNLPPFPSYILMNISFNIILAIKYTPVGYNAQAFMEPQLYGHFNRRKLFFLYKQYALPYTR